MKKKILISILLLIILTGCYNDNDVYIPDIRAYSFYETIDNPGIKKPDVGARVFYYYRICLDDFSGYTYKTDGVFIKDNSPTIEPDEKYLIGENGSVYFTPEYMDGSATIVIESEYYQREIAINCFSTTKNGAGFYNVFKPK